MREFEAAVQTRVSKQTKERFEQLARENKRRPADFLRLLIEDRIDAEKKPAKRQHAMAK